MVTGARSSVAIVEEGGIEMEGDILLVARLTEMFGGVAPLPIVSQEGGMPQPNLSPARHHLGS